MWMRGASVAALALLSSVARPADPASPIAEACRDQCTATITSCVARAGASLVVETSRRRRRHEARRLRRRCTRETHGRCRRQGLRVCPPGRLGDVTGPAGKPDGIVRILVLGDSNTMAEGGAPTWAKYLGDLFLLAAPRPPIKVINRARPSMTAGDHGRIATYGPVHVGAYLGGWLAEDHPDVALVMLGTHDLGLSTPAEYLSDVLEIIHGAEQSSPRVEVAIALVPPNGREEVFPELFPGWKARTQAFNAVLEKHLPGLLMDFHGALRWPEDFSDPVHIRTDGAPPGTPHFRLALVALEHLVGAP
jgi:hypothetical protein